MATNDKEQVKEELLDVVLSSARSICFGLQTYAFELRAKGFEEDAREILKASDKINELYWKLWVIPKIGEIE